MDLAGSWRQLLASGVRHARPIVTALLVGRVSITPVVDTPTALSRAAVLYGGDRASARGLTNVALPGGANAPASLSSQGRNRSHPPHLSGVETMEPAAGDAQL